VSTPGLGNSGRLRTYDAWVFLAVRDDLCCARPFTTGGSGPCAVILAADGADGTCTSSSLAAVRSAGATGIIGGVTAGEGTDERPTAGLSADIGLSGRVIIDTARNARAKPADTAIQPDQPAAGMMRRRNCWLRDWGRVSADVGGASPCHSHNPDSLRSVLTNRAEGDIGGVPVAIGALVYVSRISSRGSARMALTSPLSCSADIPLRSVRHPRRGSGRIGSRTVGDWPHRPDGFLNGEHRRPK
jgi:hypothetical protein